MGAARLADGPQLARDSEQLLALRIGGDPGEKLRFFLGRKLTGKQVAETFPEDVVVENVAVERRAWSIVHAL